MSLSFNKISRVGLDAASVATSIGFTAAKLGTQLSVRSPTPKTRSWLMSHSIVLNNPGHRYNSCPLHRFYPRLWTLRWAHQRGAYFIECCGLHAFHYRTNHIGPNTHIGIADIDLIYRRDWFLGPYFHNHARRGRSDVFSRQFHPTRAKGMD